MSWRKTPECQCVACKRFNVDATAIRDGIRRIHALDSTVLQDIEAELYLGRGCDLCGEEYTCVPFLPQIIKSFLRIEYLCEFCRNAMNWRRRSWPICWGATSDDEIKWFLIEGMLERFNNEVRRLSPAQLARDRAYKEWLDSLPKEEDVPDIEITLKPCVRAITN